ncbi:unnamed protein product [Leptosia nina]|uniref:Chemosensory protein n=1 Tax=Leptosia nina TaxID=320188 RepID=A0AAV1JUP2_9NEOP
MSKSILFLLAFCAVAAVVVNGREIKSIEDLDLVKLLQNEKERKRVFACLMEQAPCGNMQQFKDSLTGMIKTDCKNCSPMDKERYEMFSQLLAVAHPDKHQALIAKYRN